MRRLWYRDTYPVFCPGFQKDRVLSEKSTLARWTEYKGHDMISAVNGRKRALLTKSAPEWNNKRCTAQSTLCVGNKKGKTELKAMCDFKKKKKFFFFFFFLVSRYLGHDTIHVSPAQVSRCIDASMHRYALNGEEIHQEIAFELVTWYRWDCIRTFEIRDQFQNSATPLAWCFHYV